MHRTFVSLYSLLFLTECGMLLCGQLGEANSHVEASEAKESGKDRGYDASTNASAKGYSASANAGGYGARASASANAGGHGARERR